jgi:hypothetical protein
MYISCAGNLIDEPLQQLSRELDVSCWGRVTSMEQLYVIAAGVQILLFEKVQSWGKS